MASPPPKFFKILHHSNLKDSNLMIPEMFVKRYGNLLSSFVILKLPDGTKRRVGLRTAGDGTVWLQKGCDKFIQHYCLESGSLLVFKLVDGRRNCFKVTIFKKTGEETQYCCNVNNYTPEFDSDSDESSESSFDEVLKKRNRASVPCFHSCKKMKKEDSFLIETEPEEDEGCSNFRDIPSCKKRMTKEDEVEISRKRQEFKNRAESTYEKPGFKIVLRHSNVGGRFNMVIPNKFARKYLTEEIGSISLQTESGKNWPILYKWSKNRDEDANIYSGWKCFVQQNHLKEGYVVFFEFIKKDRFLFTKLQETTSVKKNIASNKNPFFIVEIQGKSYKRWNPVLNIPMRFASEHLSQEMENAKLKIGEKEWNVRLKQYVNHSRFSAGWSQFYHENHLQGGETCLFQMVNTKNCIFKVTIFK